ncbi:hypothetical protein PHMEG_00019555 [Phytophthora megakarya]|uniref:Uncharacterized protein n=1 Tax=Phytophthora megakarya TaxID=4795 RepID=A0A225VS42_9STRA|nr:hypothetical protein PHMEG_00019555 [Phytophthora megakarya]
MVRVTDASVTPITKSKKQGLTTMLQTVASMIRRWYHLLTSFRQQGLNPRLLCNNYETDRLSIVTCTVWWLGCESADAEALRLETVMRDFCKTQGNRAAVFVGDAKIAHTITLQT